MIKLLLDYSLRKMIAVGDNLKRIYMIYIFFNFWSYFD